jgi:hypothetical protein
MFCDPDNSATVVPMPRKPQKKRPEKDPAQYARFVEAARDAEASENPKDLEMAIKKIARKV